MRPRTVVVVAALVALPTAIAVIPGRLDAATTSWTQRSTQRSANRPATGAAIRPANKGGTATLVSVRVTTTRDDPSSADRDAVRSPARRLRFASCTNPGPGTSAYSLLGTRVNGPTIAHFNPAGAPAGAASALQAAFNTWKAADANAPSITVVSDSSVSSPQADGVYELMFAPMGRRNVGVTHTWMRNGVFESDVVFNSNLPWFLAAGEGDGCYEGVAKFDLQNAATHEFGHVYGLDHVSSAYNTMAPTATVGETYKRSLASGDAAGIQHLY